MAEYVVTMPNMYARGILFGKMVIELGDTCVVKNERHGLVCDLEFKTKVRVLVLMVPPTSTEMRIPLSSMDTRASFQGPITLSLVECAGVILKSGKYRDGGVT